MAKKTLPIIPTFDPKQTLKSIREDSLNPVIRRVMNVETSIETEVVPAIKPAYSNVKFDETTSKITFERVGKPDATGAYTDTVIDLSSIVPVYAGIEVMGYKDGVDPTDPGSGDVKNISKIKINGADVTKEGDFANIHFKWDAIVPKNQGWPRAKLEGHPDYVNYSQFEVSGEGAGKYFELIPNTGNGTLKLKMPIIPDIINGSVVGKSFAYSTVLKGIQVTGNVGGSTITPDGTLQIDLPTTGGVTPFANGNFKGFFDSLGDLDAIPASQLQADRSSGYVRSEVKGVIVYTLYMYKGQAATISDRWKIVTTRPPLIFDASSGAPDQAILSVKANSAISVNDQGQLNLDGLQNTGTSDGNFLGVYQSLDDIKAIENPVSNKSYAMLGNDSKHGLLPYIYRPPTGGINPEWVLAPALGHLMGVATGTTPEGYKPIYGIKAPKTPINSSGVLDFTKGSVLGTVKVYAPFNGTVYNNEIRTIRFQEPGSFADMRPGQSIITIYNPQRVVEDFTSDWKLNHSTPDYLGNLFYNKNTGKWMGMSNKSLAPGEDAWTPVLHKNMSVEVSNQTFRYPEKSPKVVTVNNEADRWAYAGTTWVDANDLCLPEELKGKHGAFIKTDIKDTVDFPTGLETRVQTCIADDGSGLTFMRGSDKDATGPGGKWKDWVRTSYSIQDFKDHEVDPGAHNTTHRFFRTTMVDFVWSQGPSDGILDRTHVYTFTDSYGHSHKSDKPGSIPYGGNFRMGMSVHFEGYREKPNDLPKGSWVITLIKNAKATGSETIIGAWEHKHDVTGAKEFKHFQFMQENISFDTDDQVKVKMEWIPISGTGKEALTTAAPMLRVMGTRSMIILEDMNTVSGTLVGNALTKFLGRTLDRGNVATHTHFTGPDESETQTVRTYAEKVDPHFVNMTKKT